MPLERFEVRNEYGLGAGELYKEANGEEPKAILDGVAVAGLVGILRQLGDLAEFAAEVFHGLQEQVVTTASRSHKMLVRVQQIEASLPPLEKAVLAQKSHIHFSYTAGCMWHPKIRVKQKHFIHSDLPNFILDSYEECHDPPRLHLLDKFDTGGPGACLRRYSDPSFFRKAITRSEPRNSEKVKMEKRVRKSKKNSFRRRNGLLSDTISTSQCSSRLHYESPNSYGQNSMGETISSIRMKARSEQGEHSLSSDSRTRSDYIECVFEGSSSLQQDEDHNRLATTTCKIPDDGETDSIVPGEKLGIDDDTPQGSSQDRDPSSVTWEEKTEILEPSSHQFDHIVRDEDETLELMRENCDLAKESSGVTTPKNIDSENIICASPDGLESLSEVDEFDEAGSEPDKYADALNTLESDAETDFEYHTKREVEKPFSTLIIEGIDTGETPMIAQKSEMSSAEFTGETDSEYHTKREVEKPFSTLINEGIDTGETPMIAQKSEMIAQKSEMSSAEFTGEIDSEYHTKRELEKPFSTLIIEGINTGETPMIAQKSEMSSAEFTGETSMIAQKSEMSSVEFGTVPYCASSKQISLIYPNLDSSEILVSTEPLDVTAAPADPDISVDIHLSEATGVLNILPADDCRSSCSESSSSLSSVPNSQPPVCDKILSTFVESQGSLQEVSKVSSVNVWTNGGLLGLEPSKPPDHSMSNGKQHDSMIPAEDNANDLSYNIVLPKSHLNGLREVGSLVKTPEQTDKSSKSEAGRDRSLDMVNPNNLHLNQPSKGAKTKTQTIGDSKCCALYYDKQGNETLQDNALEHSSTLSDVGVENSRHSCQSSSVSNAHGHALKQTVAVSSQGEVPAVAGGNFLSRGSNQQNIEYSLGMFGLGQRFRENGYQRKESVLQSIVPEKTPKNQLRNDSRKESVLQPILPEKTPKNQLRNDSPVSSLPPSPPLEHMKISFQPLDFFETSKLRLKFPGGHGFHESIKDVIFPSFQLLPEPAILLQDSGSESENDTFCRSSSYLSEEFLSRHSESSSEQWDSDDMYDSKDQEISGDLCTLSSEESTSSAFELDGPSHGSNSFNNGSKSSELDHGVENFHSNALFDLPSFGTVSSLSSEQERNHDSATNNHQVSELHYHKEAVPPPPPLPPVQWRVVKPHFDVAKNEQDFTFEVDSCSNDLLVLETTTQPSNPDPPNHPHINDIADCILRSKQDQHCPAENCRKLDEREDLLNQIRSKSFSLRPTVPTKSTLSESPTTNNKVAAILEKADAIRQALVGNEDGTEENWSDG